jgi:hypothetical protein
MEIDGVSSAKGTKTAQRSFTKGIFICTMLFLFFVQFVKAKRTRILRSRPDLQARVLDQRGLSGIVLRDVDSVCHFTNLESQHFGGDFITADHQ